MTTTTETREQDTQQQDMPELTYFEAKPVPGRAVFNKGDTKIEVTPNDGHGDVIAGDVTVYDTGMGVQVKRPEAPAEQPAEGQQPDLSVRISADCQTAFAYNATLTQPDNGPVSVITDGDVTLVNPEAEALEAAEGAKTEPQTGIRLNFGKFNATGHLGGREFDISLYERTVAVYASRIQVKAAAEPSTDETDTRLTLSKEFNRAVLEGANFKLRIELDKKGQAFVYSTVGVATVIAPNAETGPALDVNGDIIRLTLQGGRVFDINTANGEVTGYVPNKDTGIKNEGPPELAKPAPENKRDYQIVIGQDGQRFALNNTCAGQSASLGQSADGPLSVATDGVAQIRPVAESPSALKAEEDKIGKPVENMEGWLFLANLEGGKIQLVAKEDLGTMTRRQAARLLRKLRKQNPSVDDLPDVKTLRLAFKNATRIGGFKEGGEYMSKSSRVIPADDNREYYTKEYQTKDIVVFPSGVERDGKYGKYPVRIFCTMN
jgi:hypothetical protein